MKRALVVFLALVAFALPATAAPILFSATLTGGQESPSNLSPATGTAFVTIDDVAATMHIELDFLGLLGASTAAHIHVINGPGDANLADTVGPVATTTPAFGGFPLGFADGSMNQTYDMTLASSYRGGFITDAGGTTGAAMAALFAGIADGRAYLNIHSAIFPGGEIRGFLQPVAVPEPATLLLFGMGALGMMTRRRRRS
jgi:hypothetical protein